MRQEGSSPLALAYEFSNANSVQVLKRWGAKCLDAVSGARLCAVNTSAGLFFREGIAILN